MSVSDRNFVKEMFSVRNRWSHLSTVGIADDDFYRDLDTLQRFGKVIQADTELLEAIMTAKSEMRQPAFTSALQAPLPVEPPPPS